MLSTTLMPPKIFFNFRLLQRRLFNCFFVITFLGRSVLMYFPIFLLVYCDKSDCLYYCLSFIGLEEVEKCLYKLILPAYLTLGSHNKRSAKEICTCNNVVRCRSYIIKVKCIYRIIKYIK